MIKSLDFNINLFEDGDKFLDLLKAFIRDYRNSSWPHERERAMFAEELFEKALSTYQEALKVAESKVQGGFQTQDDLKMIQELRQKHSYWENKLKELTNGDKSGCCC
ncbi:MAG TPA: hypothetical protein GX534_02540 [Thermoanaerobacterales bacterium]|jgi:hypothetical protein|nr:hypothetical protein [Thermoanaerobacterales bacterium]